MKNTNTKPGRFCLLLLLACNAFCQEDTSILNTSASSFPLIMLDPDNEQHAASIELDVAVPSQLSAATNPFTAAVAFHFSPLRFRRRGYTADLSDYTLNGWLLNSLDNGMPPWNIITTLATIHKNREDVQGWAANSASFGGPGGAQCLTARAAKLPVQTSVAYSLANNNGWHRLQLTHASGISRSGWALATAVTLKPPSSGYYPGSLHSNWSIYAGLERQLNEHHAFNLLVVAAQSIQGRHSATTEEAKTLTRDPWYNPSWGWQQGKRRNANIYAARQRFVLLSHHGRLLQGLQINTALAWSEETNALSGLDWYHAADPRPDQYRNLPSYQPTVSLQQQVTKAWTMDQDLSQINWGRLYQVNAASPEGRASYILEDRCTDARQYGASVYLKLKKKEECCLGIGLTARWQMNNYYKKVKDLLGAKYYVNVNQYAERDFPGNDNAIQYDLDNPDQQVKEGDVLGYHYNLKWHKQHAVVQWSSCFKKWDAFATATYGISGFYRTGYMRNGLFPLNSYGNGRSFAMQEYAFKTGATYKISGRQYCSLHAAFMTKPPLATQVYLSPRTRDDARDAIVNANIRAVEFEYALQVAQFKCRMTGYYTGFFNGMQLYSFYHEEYNSLVNYSLDHINKIHCGIEFFAEYKLLPELALQITALTGRYFYKGRQYAIITMDNNASLLNKTAVFTNGFRIGGAPQQGYNLAISYRAPEGWWLNVAGNLFRNQWISINPLRRSPEALDQLNPNTDEYKSITRQHLWPAQYTLDLFIGYQKKLYKTKNNTSVLIYLNMLNLSNNKTLVADSFEQLRFENAAQLESAFAPKSRYAPGLQCRFNILLRF